MQNGGKPGPGIYLDNIRLSGATGNWLTFLNNATNYIPPGGPYVFTQEFHTTATTGQNTKKGTGNATILGMTLITVVIGMLL